MGGKEKEKARTIEVLEVRGGERRLRTITIGHRTSPPSDARVPIPRYSGNRAPMRPKLNFWALRWGDHEAHPERSWKSQRHTQHK